MSANGQQTMVILNGTTIDGTGDPPASGDAIVIESNRIKSVGPIPEDLNLEDRETVRVYRRFGAVGHAWAHRGSLPPFFRPASNARGQYRQGYHQPRI